MKGKVKNMKKVNITIDEKGNYEIDFIEGFSGVSCAEKAKEIQLLLGGMEEDEVKKPEYYDDNGDNLNELFNNN